MSDLRLALLGISLLLLAGIWWWSARGSRQARGADELREGGVGDKEPTSPAAPEMRAEPENRTWGVPPFEPLSIKTADFERVPSLDRTMSAGHRMLEDSGEFEAVSTAPPPSPAPARADDAAAGHGKRDLQKIVTLRVCAADDGSWPGDALVAALESQGLRFGRYQVYHRLHADGRSIYCVASLVEPGIFDPEMAAQQQFRGVTLFAVLPGPLDAQKTLDELLAAARTLAGSLSGIVQDAKGAPLTAARLVGLREEVARFQALSA